MAHHLEICQTRDGLSIVGQPRDGGKQGD
jgi:hypothetical protein